MMNSKTWNFFAIVLRLLKILFTLISAFGAIIVISPIIILRLFVSHLSIIRPDLHKIVDSISTNYAIDDINTDPKATTLTTLVCKGDIKIEKLQTRIVEKVIKIRKNDGELKHAILKQYPFQWMGFMFWKWEESFDISEHVYYCDTEREVSADKLQEIESELLTKPYKKSKSPWDVLVIRNIVSGSDEMHFAIMFRFHHSIGDGLSIVKNFMIPISSRDNLKLDQFMSTPKKIKKRYGLETIFNTLKMIISLPYQAGKLLVEIQDNNYWENAQLENRYILYTSQKISLKSLKEIKEIHNVGMTALIYSGFTASIRKILLKYNGKVPEYIHCIMPFPMPGHPDRLTNHFSGAFAKLPVGETDPRKRVELIQENLVNFKTNLLPIVPYYIALLTGSLFPSLIRLLAKYVTPPTISGTSFPGPKQSFNIVGTEGIDGQMSIGSCIRHAPVITISLTHDDSLRMKIAVNKGILDGQLDVDDIGQEIENEFLLLKNY